MVPIKYVLQSLDIKAGYTQVRNTKASRYLTAVRTVVFYKEPILKTDSQ